MLGYWGAHLHFEYGGVYINMKRWIAKLWARYYLRKYLTGKRTSYGFVYSMADILYEARLNPLCPRKTVEILLNYHIIKLQRELSKEVT